MMSEAISDEKEEIVGIGGQKYLRFPPLIDSLHYSNFQLN